VGGMDRAVLVRSDCVQHGVRRRILGIAEAARDFAVNTVTMRRRGQNSQSGAEPPAIQHLIAEIEIDLAAARATLARTATMPDLSIDFIQAYLNAKSARRRCVAGERQADRAGLPEPPRPAGASMPMDPYIEDDVPSFGVGALQ
jgi:alkylation response protein AidB-like acyl-CoA dehydrogenase